MAFEQIEVKEEEVEQTQEQPNNEVVEQTTEQKEGEEVEEGEQEETIEYVTAQADALHGEPVVVELPENIDPDTPEGIYHRDIANREYGREATINLIKTQFPNSYRMLLHEQNGGTLADFDRIPEFPKFEDIKENLDQQKKLFAQSLRSKGLDDEDAIEAAIAAAIKNKTLPDKVEKYIKEETDKSTKSIAELEAEVKKAEELEEADYKTLNNVLNQIYSTNTFTYTRIPDKLISESYDNFVSTLERDKKTGVFNFVVPVDNDNIKQLIELQFIMSHPELFQKTNSTKKAETAQTLRDRNRKIETTQTVANNKDNQEEGFSISRYIK